MAANFRCASAASRALRHFLGALRSGTASSFSQAGEPRVFLLRQDQVGRRGFEPGLGLFDPMLDLVLGELQTSLRSGFVGLGGRQGAAGDLDLKRDFQPQPGEGRFLPLQLRLGRFDLARARFTWSWYGTESISASTWSFSTRSFSSTKKGTRWPETDCGATLTMWASTNASSVTEWFAAYDHQTRKRINTRTIAAASPENFRRRSRDGGEVAEGGADCADGAAADCGDEGGEVDAAGVAVATDVLRNPKLQTGSVLLVIPFPKPSLP